MRNYLNRIWFILYYFCFGGLYKKLAFKTVLYPSVRVQGKKYISLGNRTVVQRGGWLLALKIDDKEPVLSVGENCAIGDFCHIASVGAVVIEDNVLIANKVYISDNIHNFARVDTPVIQQGIQFKGPVTIKEGAWIGENVCIIAANVGKNSVVGANSVVTHDVPDFSVAVGSPARVIKRYDFETQQWVSIG
ncbi:MAG TPA: acyltransferase [Mucilaginibacter sp.]